MENDKAESAQHSISPPSVTLPKGGGAIRGIGEKFAANPVTGTGSLTIPIATSPGRSGFGPQLSLSYDSGSGNGSFGFGWSLSIPSIRRKTDKGLPRYFDAEESDVYILSGAEDLVPLLDPDGSRFTDSSTFPGYTIHRYRPRIEGLFARIERWTNDATGVIHWRSITKDNITTWYGKTGNSCIADLGDPAHVFEWLICESYDDKGNLILYQYKEENSDNVDSSLPNEANRTSTSRSSNRYLKHVKYGNRAPNRDINTWQTISTQLPDDTWMFEVVLDYGDEYFNEEQPDEQGRIFVSADLDLAKDTTWPVRQDAFSTYRASFEVRTYRLCCRVLMFHHFPGELGVDNYLVRSTEFTYQENPISSYLNSVTQSGYVIPPASSKGNRYLKKSLPPVEFVYSPAPDADLLARQPIVEVEAENLENLPIGLDGSIYQWVDLDGEGTSGILTEQGNGWFYKRNLSANNQVRESGVEHTVAKFGAMEIVASKPEIELASGAQFLDLAGDGQADMVQMEGSVRGFYERTTDANWESFQPFTSWPNLNIHDPNLRFVDLTGDGHADILITEENVFLWHPSLAEDGFGSAERTQQPWDEEKGPRLVFDDGTQSIYLADLSGDGLSDLARIRNGEVCYWPNLGYGRFGAKVTMDHAPWFDEPDLFDHKRIRLVDTDGSGTTDIMYLHRESVRIYFNQCGNSWSDAAALPQFPAIDNVVSVQALDLLGNGTACLVWSSSLPGDAGHPMRYIALMDEKPHLLISVKNNLGAETRVHYAPSTKFYLDDKQNGQPWITRLPFPVHVVERTETVDLISRNRFVTRYAYHHGYFDGEEREFRGFGMVEQWDTEEIGSLVENISTDDTNWDAASYIPPAFTRTWFHTGAFIEGGRISKQFENEYYREGDLSLGEGELTDTQLESILLPDTLLPNELTADEMHEACRSLKGGILRQEIYALDRNPDGTLSEKADRPYSVSERNYDIQRLQPRGINKHAVFFTHAREQIDFYYERTLVEVDGIQRADPRVSHAMTLAVDDYGTVLRALAIAYRRRNLSNIDIPNEQKETHMVLTVNRVANQPNETNWYRIGLPVETRTYEIVRPLEPSISDTLINLFRFEEMDNLTSGLFPRELNEPSENNVWPYEKWDWRRNPANAPAETRLRLIEHIRTLYRNDDLTGFRALGDVESLALPGESYKLAFTPELITQTYTQTDGDARVTDGILTSDGRYVHSEGDANWWIPSGQIFFSPNTADSAEQELAYARDHFFLPHRYRDPFHTDEFNTETIVHFDDHDLLMQDTHDALGNIVIAKNDYRVLQPQQITDPNGNRTQVAFDALGMLAGTAVMGKPAPAPVEGDSLDDFDADLMQAEIDEFHDAPDPYNTLAPALLKKASTRIIYDLHRFYRSQHAYPNDSTLWEPPYAATLARETHVWDLQNGQLTKIQISFSYSDGFGREIQKKIQAEPEKINNVIGPPRWVGSGWTIYNNKGKPVRQYEPFFSTHHQFQFGKKVGVSPVLFYDPVERVVATLHPNHTYEKVVFDPWHQTTYDVNDTVTFDPKTDPDVSIFFQRLPDDDYLPTWYQQRTDINSALGADEQSAATKTAAHANTPTIAYFDTLGRVFLTVANNGKDANGHDELYTTRVVLDIEGNRREVIDAKGRIVMRYDYDMLGDQIHQASMDAGERWVLSDVTGKPIRAWDSRGFMREMIYDELHRPVQLWVTEPGNRRLAEQIKYGEKIPDTTVRDAGNFRTRVYEVYDGAGVVTSEAYDFKGNLLSSTRQLLSDYQHAVNWDETPAREEHFHSSTTYDALNRPLTITTPDNSIYRPTFNEANLLNEVNVNLRGAEIATQFVKNIDYNAKGQRTLIAYGNGATTTYDYDPLTFRLTHLSTMRQLDRLPTSESIASLLFTNPSAVQDLYYVYDPSGNITRIADEALRPIVYSQQNIESACAYIYDAIYRLIEAHGRENIGQMTFDFDPADTNRRDYPFMGNHTNPNDPEALRNYAELYDYDEVGNFRSLRHVASNGNWTRTYTYDETSLLEPDEKNNHLTQTVIGNGIMFPEKYSYKDSLGNDVHGCMTRINMMQMDWDFKDQLHQVDLGGGGTAYYVYDATGQRARKVIHNLNDAKVKERLYLGGYEIYREYDGAIGATDLEHETLHIMDDKQRIALVETKTIPEPTPPSKPEQLTRYQLSNHLGSASLELDEFGALISYEEYHPYGTTAYQSGRSEAEVNLKRYRYTGMERDEETGLNYHSARYYAPWLGQWVSTDPIGIRGGINLYAYCHANPICKRDIQGLDAADDFLGAAQGVGDFVWNSTVGVATRYVERAYERGGGGVVGTLHVIAALNPMTAASYAVYSHLYDTGIAAADAYESAPPDEGLLQAAAEANRMLNPIQGMVDSVEGLADSAQRTQEAIERGDAREAARSFMEATVGSVLLIEGATTTGSHLRTSSARSTGSTRGHQTRTRSGSGSGGGISGRSGGSRSSSSSGGRSSGSGRGGSSGSSSGGTGGPVVLGRRWRVGDPHDALMAQGRRPSWTTVRRRYWRNRAASAGPGEFTDANTRRMRRGLAPIDPSTGQSMELEHMTPQRTGDPNMHRDLLEVTPVEHSFFDRHRRVTDPSGRSFDTQRYDLR